jgi:putative copper export protein
VIALALLNGAIAGGIALAVGAVAVRFLLLPRTGLARVEWIPPQRLAAGAGAIAAAVVLLAAPARILLQVSQLAEPGEAWGPLALVILAESGLGRAMQLQGIWAAAALMAFTVARAGRTRGWVAAAVATAVLALTPGLAGHAAAEEHATFALAKSAVHVVAMGAWLGTLFHLWRAARRVSEATVGAMVAAFHPVAMGAVAFVALSGALQGWTALEGDLGLLATTGWGRLLVLKLLLVGGVLWLGHRHWKSSAGLLARGERAALARSFGHELLVALAVLAVTAVLTASAPPV